MMRRLLSGGPARGNVGCDDRLWQPPADPGPRTTTRPSAQCRQHLNRRLDKQPPTNDA